MSLPRLLPEETSTALLHVRERRHCHDERRHHRERVGVLFESRLRDAGATAVVELYAVWAVALRTVGDFVTVRGGGGRL